MKHTSRGAHDCIRVLLADSNQTQSQLLSAALRRQLSIKVTCCRGELSDCAEALRSVPTDIVLLSHTPSDQSRLLETIRSVQSNHPHIGLVLLLDSYDRNLVVNVTRAGARGLFWRACQPFRALCRCISVVHHGQYWMNTEQLGYVVDALSSSPSLRVINAKKEGLLTSREEQVVKLVAEGIGNRGIGQSLGIKENSVKKALQRIYDKLGVSNRIELTMYVLTHRGAEISESVPRTRRAPVASSCLDSVELELVSGAGGQF